MPVLLTLNFRAWCSAFLFDQPLAWYAWNILAKSEYLAGAQPAKRSSPAGHHAVQALQGRAAVLEGRVLVEEHATRILILEQSGPIVP